MRRSPKFTPCLSLLLGCICVWTLAAEVPEPTPPHNASASSDEPVQSDHGEKGAPFPYAEFDGLFNKLVEEMGTVDYADERLPLSLDKLFNKIPDPATKESKSIPHTRHGLLKKILANRMRQSGGSPWDSKAFSKEFKKALKVLGEFNADSAVSPTGALEKLAHATQTLFTAEGVQGMQNYLGHAATILRELVSYGGGRSNEEL